MGNNKTKMREDFVKFLKEINSKSCSVDGNVENEWVEMVIDKLINFSEKFEDFNVYEDEIYSPSRKTFSAYLRKSDLCEEGYNLLVNITPDVNYLKIRSEKMATNGDEESISFTFFLTFKENFGWKTVLDYKNYSTGDCISYNNISGILFGEIVKSDFIVHDTMEVLSNYVGNRGKYVFINEDMEYLKFRDFSGQGSDLECPFFCKNDEALQMVIRRGDYSGNYYDFINFISKIVIVDDRELKTVHQFIIEASYVLGLLEKDKIDDNYKFKRRVRENQIMKTYKYLTREGYAFIDLDDIDGFGNTFRDFMDLVGAIKEKIDSHKKLGYEEEANNLDLNKNLNLRWD